MVRPARIRALASRVTAVALATACVLAVADSARAADAGPARPAAATTAATPPAANQAPGSSAKTGPAAPAPAAGAASSDPDGPATAPADPPQAKMAAAGAQAAKTKQAVVVDDLTSQTSQTLAQPDGTFTTSFSTVPTRVRRGGAWVAVDTTLHARPDGTVVPAAVPGSVTLSGGGTGAMVSQSRDGVSVDTGWSGPLPRPKLSGDTATYADVLPGVDLKLTVTVTGVRQLLVVKNRAAAANPALNRLDFPVWTTGGTVAADANGALTVTDGAGKVAFHGAAPAMWDSSGSAAEMAAAPDQAPSTARQAVMTLRLPPRATATTSGSAAAGTTSTTVSLIPSASLLADPKAVFPLVLDPDLSSPLAAYDTVWDVADYNYLNNGSSLRSGYVWDANNQRYQTNRSFINFAGLSGLHNKILRGAPQLFLYNSYSASCSATHVALWATDNIGTWTTWTDQPNWAYSMDDQNFAFGYNSSCPGAQVVFHPTQQVTNAMNNGWDNITMGLKADNESDPTSWKIFESVKSGYAPQLVITWSSPAVAPDSLNVRFNGGPNLCGGWAGKVSSLSASPLLVSANIYSDGQGNYGGTDYVNVVTTVSDNLGNRDVSGTDRVNAPPGGTITTPSWWTSSKNYTDSWLQTDSDTVTVTVASTNLAGQTASASCSFQLDTVSPGTPSLSSTDYPREDWGPMTTQGGLFSITPGPNSGHVVKFHVIADGNANSYWDQGTANGAAATFALNCPGCAFNPFTTPGLHWLTVQADSIAGNLSNVSNRYYFFVSPNKPEPANAADLTYASANTTVAAGTQVVNQGQPGQYTQVLLWGAPNGAGLWVKDSPNDSGYYAVQAQMTSATDYGKVQLSVTPLDANGNPITSSTQTLPRVFDGYGNCCSLSTFDFGGAQLTKGTSYRFTFTAAGTSSPNSPYYNIGVSQLRLIPLHIAYTGSADPNANLAAGFDNIGITDGGTVANGDYDGVGNSYDANSLAAAGYGKGAKVTVDGVPFTMPGAAAGTADDMISSGQEIGLGNRTGSAVGLLGSLSFTQTGGTGQINYNGLCNGVGTQAFTVAPVPDWGDVAQGSAGWPATAKDRAAVTGIAWNSRDGLAARPNSLYTIMIPVACQNVPLKSVNLPWISPAVGDRVSSLKIFSVGVRPPTQGSPYVASWATSLDTTVSAGGGTVRMPIRTSLGGTSARIRLDNPYAAAPVTIAKATIGIQSSGAGTTAAPTALTFGGQASVTIPPGGQVFSDATSGFTVPSNSTLLVSLNIPTAGSYAAHAVSPVTTWTAAGEATGSTGAGYTAASTGWVLLDDLEVTPSSTSYQLGSVAVLGDQIANGDTGAKDGNQRLSDAITAALPNIAGVANVGVSGSRLLTDQNPGSGGASASTRFDRDVCELPNLSSVVVEEGDNDLHDGKTDVAVDAGLLSITQAAKLCGGSPVVVPVTPFDTSSAWNAAGEPGYWNGIRGWVTAGNLPGAGIADGGAGSVLSDTADSAKLTAAYDSGDHLTLNNAGTQALAGTISALLKRLPAGASDRYPLTADATDTINPFYTGVVGSSVGFSANDRGSMAAARFNGGSADVYVPDPNSLSTNAPIDTTRSFTVSAWVKLTNGGNTGGTQTVVAQNGNQEFGYLLGYENSANAWIFVTQASDDSTISHTYVESPALTGSQYNGWNHLVGVYDASAQKIYLYVNGTLIGSNPYHATVDFAQQMVVGGGALYKGTATDYLNGDVSDVVLYNTTALTGGQVQQLYTATVVNGAGPPVPGNGPQAKAAIPASGLAGTPLSVDASASTAGAVAIAGYTVNFGDGTVVGPQAGAVFSHTYAAAGTFTVTVTATDTAGVSSTTSQQVAVSAPPAGWWKLSDGPGTTAADSGTPGGHPATATGNAQLAPGGYAMFDRAAGENLATTGQVVDTSKSFSVSAWAYLPYKASTYTVAAQNGTTSYGFWLGFDHTLDAWALETVQADATATSTYAAAGPAGSAAAGTWTHLLGVFDATSGKLSLYVNGVLQSRQDVWPTPFAATGQFMIGDSLLNGAPANTMHGGIADLRVYPEALSGNLATALYHNSVFTPPAGLVYALAAPTALTSSDGTAAACSTDPAHPATSTSATPALGATLPGTAEHADFEIRDVTNPQSAPPLYYNGPGSGSGTGSTVGVTAPALVNGHEYAFSARAHLTGMIMSASAPDCYVRISVGGQAALPASGAVGVFFDNTLYPASAGPVTWTGPVDNLVWTATGHLQVVKKNGQVIWDDGAAASSSAVLALQSDGGLVIYAQMPLNTASGTLDGTALWSPQIANEGTDTLVVQTDGNVAAYAGTTLKWSTGTNVQTFADVGTGNCLDGPTTSISTAACGGAASQNWTIADNGDGTWSLKDSASGDCLDGNTTSVYAGSCTGASSQRWSHSWGGSGWVLTSQATGLALDSQPGGTPFPNTANGGASQQWK